MMRGNSGKSPIWNIIMGILEGKEEDNMVIAVFTVWNYYGSSLALCVSPSLIWVFIQISPYFIIKTVIPPP